MTDDEPDRQPDHRFSRDVPASAISLRQPEDEDGVFDVRMPIATTGEVRNEGDDPLSRDELDGMARQIDDRAVPVFLDHGRSSVGGPKRYSAVEKIGEWTEANVRERDADDTDELVATARVMDPETLPNLGGLREAIGSIREQVKRDFSLSASIGWRDDDSAPGGVDLMEASIVGIGADPRTTSNGGAAVVARAAVEAGADPDRLVQAVREATEGDRGLTSQQIELARSVLEQFESEQGDAALADFDSWIFESDDELSADESVAARAVVDEYVRSTTPWQDPISETLRPWLSEQDQDSNDMTDESDESADDADDTTEQDGEPEETHADAEEFRERMLELQEQQMETLEAIAERVTDEDDDEDEDEEDQAGDDEEDEDDEDENAADDARDLESEIETLREELAEVRDGGIGEGDVDTGDEHDADADDETDEPDDKHAVTNKYGIES